MKTLNTFFLLLTLILVSNSYAQTQPDKQTTYNYIKKIFFETVDYEEKSNNGAIHKVGVGEICGWKHMEFVYNYLEYCVMSISENWCSNCFKFREIKWEKMLSIEDDSDLLPDSPVKYLKIKFIPNSILFKGYISPSTCNVNGQSYCGTEKSTNFIYFPYRNEEGVRERLVKALNHLSKLEKEEQAKNDPFGN